MTLGWVNMTKKNDISLLIIIVLLLVNVSCKVKDNKKSATFIKCTIMTIDSISGVYVIHAKSQSSYFKIVSAKTEDIVKTCKKIKVGKSYEFHLTSLFNNKQEFLTAVDGVDFNGQSILLERDSIYDIHTAKELNGLCFIKDL